MKNLSQFQRALIEGTSTSNEPVRHSASERDESTVTSQRSETSEDRLDSWKEIAAYLRREVRTVQRWEKHESLPVHRHIHNKVGSIYAFKTEIDEWRMSRSPSPSAGVPKRRDPGRAHIVRLSSTQFKNQLTVLNEADKPSWKGRDEDSIPTIIYIAPGLLALSKELQSLRLGNLLAIGVSTRNRRVSGLAESSAARTKQ